MKFNIHKATLAPRFGHRRIARVLLAFLLIFSFQFARYTAQASTSSSRWQRPTKSKPVRPSPWGRYRKLARARSVDGMDYMTFDSSAPKDQLKQPAFAGDSSAYPLTVLETNDKLLEDLSTVPSERDDQTLAHSSIPELDAIIPRPSGVVQAFLPPTPSFYCLHEHIRERAPPILS